MAQKRKLKNWLTGYANYTRHSESPDLFHFWTGVFTIAGALRRQVWIDQRYFQWTPNFYIILVGPPGVAAKSTSLGLGAELLKEVDGVYFGPNSMTWQGLITALEESAKLIPYPGDIFWEMSCVTCNVRELGTFLRPDDKEMMDVLVDLWDGQSGEWKRHTRGQEGQASIINPWLNVMACTTPSWLRDNFPESMVGGGLTSRIVFVYGDEKRHLVPYPSEAFTVEEFEVEKQVLIHDLKMIAEMKGAYELTKEAKEWGSKWYTNHWAKKPDHMISDRFGGYIARKQTHIHKLAIVLAAAESDTLLITAAHLALADQMMTGLEAQMGTVFESIGVGDTSRYVQELLAYVRAYKEIEDRELWRHMLPIMEPKEYVEATAAAIKAGYMKSVNRGGKMMLVAITD